MSSSSDAGFREVERAVVGGTVTRPLGSGPDEAMPLPELRVGEWTRLGGRNALGDAVTESLLGGIAAEARDAARAQGYTVGWAEGRRAAAERAAVDEQRRAAIHAEDEARREAEHRAALDALAQAAEQVRGLLGDLVAQVEDQAAELAWAVTRELVGHEVACVEGPQVVARVLQVLPPTPVAQVRVHPSAAASAAAGLGERGLTVVPDASLDRADAVVEAADGSVTDLRVDEAMARVREVLR